MIIRYKTILKKDICNVEFGFYHTYNMNKVFNISLIKYKYSRDLRYVEQFSTDKLETRYQLSLSLFSKIYLLIIDLNK